MKGVEELAQLTARLAGLEEDVEVLGSWMRDLRSGELTLTGPTPAGGPAASPGPPDGEPVEPFFGSLLEFVTCHLTTVYTRPTSPTVRWCASWWDHAEALYRLEALWRTFEVHRLDARVGLATWQRDFLDPQLRELLSPTGPFAQCTDDRHSPPKPLRTDPPPPDYLTELSG